MMISAGFRGVLPGYGMVHAHRGPATPRARQDPGRQGCGGTAGQGPARPEGLEPPPSASVVRRTIQSCCRRQAAYRNATVTVGQVGGTGFEPVTFTVSG
jgi:hypothetical protein